LKKNRNEALDYARPKCEYVLLMDADDYLMIDKDYQKPRFDIDAYFCYTYIDKWKFNKWLFVKTSIAQWKGMMHEYITTGVTQQTLTTIKRYCSTVDGARSHNPNKYADDAKILEEEMKKNPTDTRNQFYLAQSYKDSGNAEKSIENYKKRIAMGGDRTEIFYSYLMISLMYINRKENSFLIKQTLIDCYHASPNRVEPLYYLAKYFHETEHNYVKAMELLNTAMPLLKLSVEKESFLSTDIYNFLLKFERSLCLYYVQSYEEGLQECLELLAMPDLPKYLKTTIRDNIFFYETKIKEIALEEFNTIMKNSLENI